MNFQASARRPLAMDPEYRCGAPIVDILDYLDENDFTASTSARERTGLVGLLAAKLLTCRSPARSTPTFRYAERLYPGSAIQRHAGATSLVLRHDGRRLRALARHGPRPRQRGLDPSRVHVLPPWVDRTSSHLEAGRGAAAAHGAMATSSWCTQAAWPARRVDVLATRSDFSSTPAPGHTSWWPATALQGRDGAPARRLPGELPRVRLAAGARRRVRLRDLLVFPSTPTRAVVVLEAQAAGLPVIVTDQAAPSSSCGLNATASWVPGDDPEALTRAMSVLRPTRRAAAHGRAAREFVVGLTTTPDAPSQAILDTLGRPLRRRAGVTRPGCATPCPSGLGR